MKIAISQPTYLPWIGYLDLLDQVDMFVVLDNVQFVKQSWQQRNRIKTAVGLQWLTVPAKLSGRFGQLISEVEIRDPDFHAGHLRAIELAYRRAPYFQHYFGEISRRLGERRGEFLVDLNLSLLTWIMESLQINTPLLKASMLGQSGKRTELLANICADQEATQYISPVGSASYLVAEQELLSNRGVEVFFHHYEHPEYRQLHKPFEPFASVIDLMFNEGPAALEILRSGRRACYSVDRMRELH